MLIETPWERGGKKEVLRSHKQELYPIMLEATCSGDKRTALLLSKILVIHVDGEVINVPILDNTRSSSQLKSENSLLPRIHIFLKKFTFFLHHPFLLTEIIYQFAVLCFKRYHQERLSNTDVQQLSAQIQYQ